MKLNEADKFPAVYFQAHVSGFIMNNGSCSGFNNHRISDSVSTKIIALRHRMNIQLEETYI